MAFQKFMKDNLILMVGIFLPILLVLLFLAVSYIPRFLATPPAYDFLFVDENAYNYNKQIETPVRITIRTNKNGKIVTKIKIEEKTKRYSAPIIYRYSAADNVATPVHEQYFHDALFEDSDTIKKTKTLALPEDLEELTLNKNSISPDGYTFDKSYDRYNRGLVGEFFGGRRYDRSYRLVKGNAVFPISVLGGNNIRYSYNSHVIFLGWITGEDE